MEERKLMSKLKAVTRAPDPLEKYIEPFDSLFEKSPDRLLELAVW